MTKMMTMSAGVLSDSAAIMFLNGNLSRALRSKGQAVLLEIWQEECEAFLEEEVLKY